MMTLAPVKLAFAAAALAASAPAASAPATVIALPVGPGLPGHGPFTIQVWPYEGCKGCAIDPADLEAFKAVLSELLAESGTPSAFRHVQYSIVRLSRGQGEQPTSLDKVRAELKGCKIGATGKLAPNPTSRAVAFGARFDCASRDMPGWMSVVIGREHKPRAVYWLPDKPIYAAGRR